MAFRYKSLTPAEHSRRTRDGQDRARAAGKTWWATNPAQQALMVERAVATHRRQADQRALAVLALANELRAEGITSIRGMTRELNARGLKTPSGGIWTRLIIRTMLERAERLLLQKSQGHPNKQPH